MNIYAGFWQRTKAFAFDYIFFCIYLVAVTAMSLLIGAVADISSLLFSNRALAQVSGFLIVTLPITLYFAAGESSSRQATWGKRRVGLKVQDRGGDRIGFWRAMVRTALKFMPWELSHTLIWELYFSTRLTPVMVNFGFGLVYGLIGLNIFWLVRSKTKQGLHDLFAGTYVVEGR